MRLDLLVRKTIEAVHCYSCTSNTKYDAAERSACSNDGSGGFHVHEEQQREHRARAAREGRRDEFDQE